MNRKRIQALRDMLEGIPEKRIDLNRFVIGEANPLNCRTIACMGGWAAMYPPFIEEGLAISKVDNYSPIYRGRIGFSALMAFFDMRRDIFAQAQIYYEELGTDKQIALARLDALLKGA